jgi:hypothetical protein
MTDTADRQSWPDIAEPIAGHITAWEGDRLVIAYDFGSGVQPPRPPVLRQDAHDLFELALHLGRHVGTRLAEVLEVGRREYQHFAGAVVPEVVVALLVCRGLGPV